MSHAGSPLVDPAYYDENEGCTALQPSLGRAPPRGPLLTAQRQVAVIARSSQSVIGT